MNDILSGLVAALPALIGIVIIGLVLWLITYWLNHGHTKNLFTEVARLRKEARMREELLQHRSGGGAVRVIDNTSPDDNWLYNKCSFPVTVVCHEMFGNFTVHLKPGEERRITYNVQANAYRLDAYSWDDLKYTIGERERWEVRTEQGKIIMVKV